MSPEKIYTEKEHYLRSWLGAPVSPRSFYESIFPAGDLERQGHPEDHKPNAIVMYSVPDDRPRHDPKPVVAVLEGQPESKKKHYHMRTELVFADLKGLMDCKGKDFAVTSLCTYSGRRRTAKAAYRCYGYAIDLDGVAAYQLEAVRGLVEADLMPRPTYIVNSGHGCHIYYIFYEPVPLYPAVRGPLQKLKRGLTDVVWTRETSSYKPKDRQYQGIYQGYRVVGSCSKIGRTPAAKQRYRVTAYRCGDPVDLMQLSQYVDDDYKIPADLDLYGSGTWADGHLTLDKARELYPEWYQKRIVDKQPAGQYVQNRGLYDWWLKKVREVAKDGNRYWCICVLFAMARKCNLSKDEAMSDALGLVRLLDNRTMHDENAFTVKDIKAASAFYKSDAVKMTNAWIEVHTGARIEHTRRNGRSQTTHIKLITAMRDVLHPDGTWRNMDGRPDKQGAVQQWRQEHPDGTKAQCIRDTGLSKPTVYKWWGKGK